MLAQERFIEELQGQLVVTVQEKEAEAAAQANRAAAELMAVHAELEEARANGGGSGGAGSPLSPGGGVDGKLSLSSGLGKGGSDRSLPLEDAPAIGSMVGRELAAHYYEKYKVFYATK